MTEQQTAAMRQALEALELEDMACRYEKEPTPEHIANAITALRQALEQAEQEPVAIIEKEAGFETEVYATGYADSLPDGVFKLYAAPVSAKREWVDLTDGEIEEVCISLWSGGWRQKAMNDFARAVIAKFKEKQL